MADNFHFDMTGVALDTALMVAFGGHRKATGWAEIDCAAETRSPGSVWNASKGVKKRLVLFWTECADANKLPAPLAHEDVVPFVKAWLAAAEYGPQPDHDGDNSKGWRVYNEAWGHVGNKFEAFVAIEPVWLLHGK